MIHVTLFTMTPRFVTSVVLLWLSAFATPSRASVISVQFPSEPTQYDPLLIEDAVGLRLAANTMATVFEFDGKGERQKALIDSYSVSRDRKTYTFKFKQGLKWSDGKPLMADHFILAITRLANSPIKAALSSIFPKFDLKRTKAVDARTAVVTLQTPDQQFPNWLSLPPFAPIRQDMVDALQNSHNPMAPTLAAYQAVEYGRGDHVTLKKNPNFRAFNVASPDEVKIRFIPDDVNLYSLMKAGSVDVLTKIPSLELKDIESISKIATVPVEAVTYLGINTKKPPFNELKNRLALRDALNQENKRALAKILKADESPADFFIPSSMRLVAFTHPREEPVKPEEKSYEFSIQSDGGSRNQTILEFVQSRVRSELKWKPELDVVDWKTHYSKLKTDPDSIFRFGWQNPVSDPFMMYQLFSTNSPNNYTGWSNAKYDSLVEQLRQETTLVKKTKLMSELEQILWKEAPVIPLLYQNLKYAYSKRVSGFRANPFGVILFNEIRLVDQVGEKKN